MLRALVQRYLPRFGADGELWRVKGHQLLVLVLSAPIRGLELGILVFGLREAEVFFKSQVEGGALVHKRYCFSLVGKGRRVRKSWFVTILNRGGRLQFYGVSSPHLEKS